MLAYTDRIRPHMIEHKQSAIEDDVLIRRIEEHESGAPDLVGRALEPADDVATDDARSLFQLEGVQVLAQDSKTARPLVHERDLARASRHRPHPDAAGAC